MENSKERYERGLEILRYLSGEDEPAPVTSLADVAPDLGRYIAEFAYGDIYARKALPVRDRQLVTIGALTALGHAVPQLRFHISGALNAGCSREEVVEAIMHCLAYAGFPAVINALGTAREVFDARSGESE